LVFGGNEGTDVHGLTESKHATSGGSSDAFLRVDHRYEGDENAHCDDGAESENDDRYRDDEGSHSDEELRGDVYH
jgi:hypothetical protein